MNRFWKSIINPIFDKIKPRYIVEVGSGVDENTKNILTYCKENSVKLMTVDPLPMFELEEFKVKYGEKFEIQMDSSLNILPILDDYDVIFLNGDPNWYSVYNELKIIEKKFENKKFPIVFLHNIGWPYGKRDLYPNPEIIPPDSDNLIKN